MAAAPRSDLLTADPVALTQREMLLRLDSRMDAFEGRVRSLEDINLTEAAERKTYNRLLSVIILLVPVATTIALRVFLPPA